ncbi:MAG TPA: T9SS type A sorting domain-containing protein [Bacteroidia bacterium]
MKLNNLIILLFMAHLQYCYAQIGSTNIRNGFAESTEITEYKDYIYYSGTYNGDVKICNKLFNGYLYGSPFIVKTQKFNQHSVLLQPTKSLTGHSSYKHLYTYDNSLYITGVFTRSMAIKNDTIDVGNKWKTFILKLDEKDSLIWFKVLDYPSTSIAPQLMVFDNKIYSSYEYVDKEFFYIKLLSIDINTGSISDVKEVTKLNNGEFIGFNNHLDTIFVYYKDANRLYCSSLTPNSNISVKSSEINGVLVKGEICSKDLFAITHLVSGDQYKYSLNVWKENKLLNFDLFKSSFLGSIDVIEINDSIIQLGGFFNNTLEFGSAFHRESNSSNSFLLKYNYQKGLVCDFHMINSLNVFKFKKIDSTIYLISNYIDGGGIYKQGIAGNISERNTDFKIELLTYKDKVKITPVMDSALPTYDANFEVYPNTNSGEKIFLKVNSDLNWKSIEVFNALGQKVSSNLEIDERFICIKPLNKLIPGVYVIEIIYADESKKSVKFVVN